MNIAPLHSLSCSAALCFLTAGAGAQEADAREEQLFESEVAGFRIACPQEGWRILSAQDSGSGATVVLAGEEAIDEARITVQAVAAGPAFAPRSHVAALLRQVEGLEGYSELKEIERSIAGRVAPGIFTRMTHQGKDFRVRMYVLGAHEMRFEIRCYARAEVFERYGGDFDEALDSLVLTEPSGKHGDRIRLRKLAARCGSEVEWAEDWKTAARHAKRESKLVAVFVQSYPGFDLVDEPSIGPLMEPDVVALLQARFVAFRWSPGTPAAFRAPEVYGLGPSTFGQAVLLATPDGSIVRETFSMNPRAVYELLHGALAGHPGIAAAPEPPKRSPRDEGGIALAKEARWYLQAGDLERAAAALAEAEETAPNAAGVHRVRADWLRLQRRGEEALATLQKAKEYADPEELPFLLEDEAILLARLERTEEARELLESLPAESASPRALYWLGATQLRLRDAEQAAAVWQRLVDEHPDHRWAWRAAGRMLSPTFALGVGPRLSWPSERLLDSARPRVRGRVAMKDAGRAMGDAIAWLLADQREDGSWMSPSEMNRRKGDVDVFTQALTAIAGMALLRLEGNAEARAAAERATEHLLATWDHLQCVPESEKRSYLMDYWPWAYAYALRFFADCLDAGLGDAERLQSAMAGFVAELGERQKSGGGWSYFLSGRLEDSDQPADQSISFTTAAVLLGLLRAEEVGIEVPVGMRDAGLDCLEAMRAGTATFGYMLDHGSGTLSASGRAGSAGRGPVCALALYRGGREELDDLRRRMEIFAEHAEVFGREQGKALMHAGEAAQGSHYLMFDYANAADAMETLAATKHRPWRKAVLEQVLNARNADGSFTDNPLLGRSYTTAMAIVALQHLGVEPAVP